MLYLKPITNESKATLIIKVVALQGPSYHSKVHQTYHIIIFRCTKSIKDYDLFIIFYTFFVP